MTAFQTNLNHSSCSDKITEVDANLTVVQLSSTHNVCVAHEECRQYGERMGLYMFLIGRHFTRLPDECIAGEKDVWTSLNDLLINSGTSKTGWKDADPRDPLFASSDNSFNWLEGQPGGNEHAVGLEKKSRKIHDIPMLWRGNPHQIVCQMAWSVSTSHPIMVLSQFRSDYPSVIRELISQSTTEDSCYESFTSTTAIECAKKCYLNAYCRSSYFHNDSNTCISMLYVDAKVPSKFAQLIGPWKRYARTA
ncbi:unnamed protein product [Echinostoma caproni]|uniref:Apple domain-containing protein n=1 Tax=Echinostoma caproni TaxID=27848 RepID=A0A183AHI2_9TREM|nr:unnamed protein product [Echinostoma caproni]